MALSPTDILERLKELKMWQESQEEILKKIKNTDPSPNITSASDYQTIDGLSAFNSTISDENSPKKTANIESQVITPTKSFNELLEEKLAEDPGPVDSIPKEKRPFLKKGTGLERFRTTTRPPPKPTKRNIKVSKSENNRSVTPLRAPDLSVKPKAAWSKVDDSGEQVRKINAHLEKSERGEQTLYERQLEKELLIFEALEEKAENSSFCSTNSSVVRILSSTPNKIQATIPEEKRVHWESETPSEDEDVIVTDLERHDIAEILLRLKTLAENNKPKIPSIIDASDDDKWSSNEPSSDNTSISSGDLEETLKTGGKDIAVGTHDFLTDGCIICGDALQKKIAEYEKKIQDVRNDENKIDEIRRQLEQRERDFLKKKREFEEERQDSIFELETEKEKLTKQKQAFQTHMKETQNRPTKKERQEITNLKKEIADLSETQKLKESKNGMSQARLRNQIKQLEKENLHLKEEVEKLTKENAKLSATQKMKRKSSDSKMLNEINKNITRLTQDSIKNTKKVDHKENDKNENKRNSRLDTEDSFLLMESNKKVDIEEQYENTFRDQSLPNISKTNEKIQRTLDDGSKQTKYTNGNSKTVSPDGNFITVQYFNGDKQETNLLDGTIKYYFSKKNICQTTFPDGLEVVEFPEGITEKRHTDGKSEVTLPDGVVQTTYPDGIQETKYTDGSTVKISPDGEKILFLPNGQKEIETKEYKRREYPDGTVKILYPDGTLETKYANGRVRIKDGNGTLILDTQS